MTLWQDITATALLGTERQPIPTFAPGNALGDMLAQITRPDNADREAALLGAAATISLYQEAGQVPVIDNQPLPDPSPPDDRPRCSPTAGQYLSTMLDGEYTEVLPEWLKLVDAAGQRIPEESLPAFLSIAERLHTLRQVVLRVIGERGQWLIRHNPMPTWNYALSGDSQAIWQTGNITARATLLEHLHAAEPDRARELLTSTWLEDRAEDRVAFLTAISSSVTLADEAFLEQALDDRSKQVRAQAAELLARLPGSALCERMTGRAKHHLKLKTGKKPGIRVTLPDTLYDTMGRDGVQEKPPSGIGAKAWWLTQVLAAVPPSFWSQAWKKTPAELIELADHSDNKKAMLGGWTWATTRYHDMDWAETLLKVDLAAKDIVAMPTLVGVLTPERVESLVIGLLTQHPDEPLHGNHLALPILEHYTHRWSDEMTILVLDKLYRRLEGRTAQSDYTLPPIFKKFALYMSPSALHEAEEIFQTNMDKHPTWGPTIERFLDIMRFRHDMLKEFPQ